MHIANMPARWSSGGSQVSHSASTLSHHGDWLRYKAKFAARDTGHATQHPQAPRLGAAGRVHHSCVPKAASSFGDLPT